MVLAAAHLSEAETCMNHTLHNISHSKLSGTNHRLNETLFGLEAGACALNDLPGELLNLTLYSGAGTLMAEDRSKLWILRGLPGAPVYAVGKSGPLSHFLRNRRGDSSRHGADVEAPGLSLSCSQGDTQQELMVKEFLMPSDGVLVLVQALGDGFSAIVTRDAPAVEVNVEVSCLAQRPTPLLYGWESSVLSGLMCLVFFGLILQQVICRDTHFWHPRREVERGAAYRWPAMLPPDLEAPQEAQQRSEESATEDVASVLRSLPRCKFATSLCGERFPQLCVVCLSPWEKGDMLRVTPCAHAFHDHCLRGWLARSCTCAVCRRDLR
eukprot:CAMPEP_0179079548 /NCGR_PEP_ID=MMETSP0796-20121207/35700_1 /TAXON_ID=73915 /ORGANISM="Pyrodinium bahamense, Strain pbaha01" /LENGTH=324 /DNA_ID=CAMNT_0020776889 /DNA_START=119 /DNA_END=1090 /DNA_ORIENTATION=+